MLTDAWAPQWQPFTRTPGPWLRSEPLLACRALLQTGPHFRRLNDSVVQLLDDFAMVTFTVGWGLCCCAML